MLVLRLHGLAHLEDQARWIDYAILDRKTREGRSLERKNLR